MTNIGILGAGTWGTALARMLANNGHNVTVWSAIEKEVTEFAASRRHPNLPGMVIPDSIRFTADIEEACGGDMILFAVPSVFVRSTAKRAAPYVGDRIIVDVAKGIEPGTLKMMSEIISEETGSKKVVALSGPTHAEEVAKDLLTTIVSACADHDAATQVQNVFTNTCMRVYTNSDIKGVELCGALKNIIALASGICAGLGFGDNAKAALITRGLAEIARLGAKMNCNPETFMGLSGMGDLIVTATSMHSRNNRCGMLIGGGMPVEEAVKTVGMVVEGIYAVPAAIELSKRYDVEMPIIESVSMVLDGADPKKIVVQLMERARKSEVNTELRYALIENSDSTQKSAMNSIAIAHRMLADGKLSLSEIAVYTGIREADLMKLKK